MLKFQNTKTQAVIETACAVGGGAWVQIKDQPEDAEPKAKKTSKKCKKDGE